MLRVALRLLGVLLLLLLAVAGGFAGLTSYRYGKTHAASLPHITRDSSPVALARGERLFRSVCAQCHVNDEDGRARGKTLPEYPSFMGTFASANLTSDPVGGIGAWTDQEIARLVRTGIGRDGKAVPMPPFRHLGDTDLAAMIGFLRSSDALFAPMAVPAPKSQVSLAGKGVFVWIFGVRTDVPASVPTPPRAPTAEYGKYMATFFDCYQCHTEGFSGNKLGEPGLYAGGFEYRMADGKTLYSPNITPDATGLGGRKWTAAQFATALRDGVTPDGRVLRFPMPRYRHAEDIEFEAIFAYLQTVPRSIRPSRAGTLPVAKASETAEPEKLWQGLGCVACHGDGGIYRDKIKASVGRPAVEVARWIRNAQELKPGTQMPTFADLIDEPRARVLAEWVQQRAATMK